MQRPDCMWRCFDNTVTKAERPAKQWLNTIMRTLTAKFGNIDKERAKQREFNEKNEEYVKKFYQKLQAFENKIETKLADFSTQIVEEVPNKMTKTWEKLSSPPPLTTEIRGVIQEEKERSKKKWKTKHQANKSW